MENKYSLEDPFVQYMEKNRLIIEAGRNPVNIKLEKKFMRLQINNITLRLKRLFEKRGIPEQWNKMKIVWKNIINFYKEKGLV